MEKLTRGRFVARAAVAAAGVTVVGAPEALASRPGTTIYLLDPCAGPSEGRRCSCRACEAHAANKVFLSSQAADAGRAHAHCNCGIVPRHVPPGLRRALETHANGGSADRRSLPPGLARQL